MVDFLDRDTILPYDEDALLSGDATAVAEYTLELVNTIQEILLALTAATNKIVSSVVGDAIYYAPASPDGTYPNGTWRRIQVGENLELQKKISGNWIQTKVEEPPI